MCGSRPFRPCVSADPLSTCARDCRDCGVRDTITCLVARILYYVRGWLRG
jgi:hypothetical protein